MIMREPVGIGHAAPAQVQAFGVFFLFELCIGAFKPFPGALVFITQVAHAQPVKQPGLLLHDFIRELFNPAGDLLITPVFNLLAGVLQNQFRQRRPVLRGDQ